MITWMQKHKKWLVITIWISAIAFIGAGMVNWGSYGFGLSNDKVAQVGEIDIHIPEFQRTYSRIFRTNAEMMQTRFGLTLDEAQAKQLGLPQQALQQMIQQTQLLNFAHDLGLMVSDEEVGRTIIDEKVYVDENGQFSQTVYEAALRDMGLSKSEFEEDIRNTLLLQKVLKLMNVGGAETLALWSATPLEKDVLKMTHSISDKLMIKTIPLSQIQVSVNDEELKAFWQKNADNWKSPMEFEIEYILIPFNEQNPSEEALKEHYENFKSDYLDENGQLLSMEQSKDKLTQDVQKLEAESAAKRAYRDLKNGDKSGIVRTLKEDERFFIHNGVDLVVADMKVAQEGQVLQPIEADEGFVTLKILHKKESINQSFEEAKEAVTQMYKHQKAKEELVNLAKESVKNFSGINTGFVSLGDRFASSVSIPTLSNEQKAHFLSQVFGSQESEGYVLFDDKVVLYRVLEQTLSHSPTQDNEMIAFAKNAKIEATLDALAEYLEQTYKTTIYIDVSK
ncbi:MAG: SurA N-terminal domain-containing protein [Helicobacter sp.]|uniref:peptidylprolyl isomerase n=1 Tax=Helicobacter sp. TaxID=218 RepID=UPI0025BB98DD|nr:peptidylprolyl isomerase [Helicobacter sp.]MCH5313607.1 SurA N-terminal domain-containing protein [Helicobacter sp.]